MCHSPATAYTTTHSTASFSWIGESEPLIGTGFRAPGPRLYPGSNGPGSRSTDRAARVEPPVPVTCPEAWRFPPAT